MKRIALIILPLLFFTFHGLPQDAFYKHFEGKIGDNINVVVDLVRSGKHLSGYYYYFFDDRAGDTSFIHYGKSMPVYGEMNGNAVEFSEFDPDVKGAVFKGWLKQDTLEGTWAVSEGKKQLPFKLIAVYPEGTMPFDAIYMNETGTLFDKKASPKATIEISLLVPGKYALGNVADSVRLNIYYHFFNSRQLTSEPAMLLDTVKELYFYNYRKSNADLYQEGAASFDWQKKKEIKILHNENNILSLEYYDYGYTGGAHGLGISNFRVIDILDGHQVCLNEIFRDDYSNDLRDIINSAARKKYRLERNQVLTDADFFVQYLDPTSNFYVTKDGIGFFYNQYEVAPFALGPIEIFVSYQELNRILRANSPVFRMFSSR